MGPSIVGYGSYRYTYESGRTGEAPLAGFARKYEFAPGAYATVRKNGDALKWQAASRPKVTLVPLSDTRFYARVNDAEMTFSIGDKGQATDVIVRLGSCQESKAKKVE